MKIFKRSAVRHKLKTIALGSGANVSFGWSNYEGNEQGDYSASIIQDGEIHRVEFTHDELARLVRYWNETENGTRQSAVRSSATIGQDKPELCSACKGRGWVAIDIGRSIGRSKPCARCCKHDKGGWLLTDAHSGYEPGHDTYACKNGCGTIVKQVRTSGMLGRDLKIL